MKKPGRTYFFVSAIIYLLSLTQETFHISGGNPSAWSNGFANLLFGFVSGQVTWFANPVIFLSWISLNYSSKYAIVPSLTATVLCLQFLTVDELVTSEAGHFSQIISYHFGYWLWLASAVMCLVGSLHLIFAKNRTKQNSKIETQVL